jgi:hypothetical protein
VFELVSTLAVLRADSLPFRRFLCAVKLSLPSNRFGKSGYPFAQLVGVRIREPVGYHQAPAQHGL